MSDQYGIGDTIKLTAVFRDELRQRFRPTTLTLTIQKPSGASVVVTSGFLGLDGGPAIRRGEFRHDEVLDESGVWYWRWEAAGRVHAAEEGRAYVAPSALE